VASRLPAAALLLAAAAPGLAQDAAPQEDAQRRSAFEDLDRAARAIVERCGPAVVRVEADRPVTLRAVAATVEARRLIEASLRRVCAQESVTGTGFLVDDAGLVLTTAAAAGSGASAIRVGFPGRGVREGTLVGEDALSGVALVRVGPVEGVRALRLAEGPPAAGALALLLAPSPLEAPVLHLGFVTEPRRAFGAYDAYLVSSVTLDPGHAGAPLLDARGSVLGVAVAAREVVGVPGRAPSSFQPAAQNLQELVDRTRRIERAAPFSTFVPAEELRRILADLRERGAVRRGMVGVLLASAPPVVEEVLPLTPAAAAGIAKGDLVTSVDGVPVDSAARFGGFVQRRAPGTLVRVGIRSPGSAEREVEVRLAELPFASRRPALFRGLGVQERPHLGDRRGGGVVVSSVDEGSPAAAAGLLPGDRILSIGGESVPSVDAYVSLTAGRPGEGDQVQVRVLRPGEPEPRTILLK